MGWDYLVHTRPAKAKDYLDKQFTGLVASAMIGNEYYAAIKMTNTDKVFGLVVIVDRKNGEFGYKSMDEQMGPYFYKCPDKILKLLSPTTNEHALKWREMCAKVREMKNAAKKIQTGDVIKFEDRLSFGAYGMEDTFTVTKKDRAVRFYMEKNGMLCRITNWKTRPFTIIHKANG
jgi:hypothetical protein